MSYRKPIWFDTVNHNEDVAEVRRRVAHAEAPFRALSGEQMVEHMRSSPSHEKYRIFEEEFRSILDAQTTVWGADNVTEHWNQMNQAYREWCSGEA